MEDSNNNDNFNNISSSVIKVGKIECSIKFYVSLFISIIIDVIIIIYVIYKFYKKSNIQNNWIKSSATVSNTQNEQYDNNGNEVNDTTVNYTYTYESNTYTNSYEINNSNELDKNQALVIYINPNDHSKSIVNSQLYIPQKLKIILIIVFFMFAIIGTLMFVILHKKSWFNIFCIASFLDKV
jgi:hypothetical protein